MKEAIAGLASELNYKLHIWQSKQHSQQSLEVIAIRQWHKLKKNITSLWTTSLNVLALPPPLSSWENLSTPMWAMSQSFYFFVFFLSLPSPAPLSWKKRQKCESKGEWAKNWCIHELQVTLVWVGSSLYCQFTATTAKYTTTCMCLQYSNQWNERETSNHPIIKHSVVLSPQKHIKGFVRVK